MSFDWRIEWNGVVIPDCISANIHKSTEIQNNLCNLTLKNSASNQSSFTLDTASATDGSRVTLTDTTYRYRIGDYINPVTGTILFKEEDSIKVWATYLTDATEVGTAWYDDTRLLGAFGVEEYQIQTLENQNRIQLKAVDAAYLLFNKIYNFSYGVGNVFTAPGIIRHCARKFGEKPGSDVFGTHNDTGTEYAMDAKFLSEGGYIEDIRRIRTAIGTYSYDKQNQLNGAINSSVTTITVDSTTGFEDDGTLVIDTEHISYTGKSGTQFTGCTRGIDDTSAASHLDDAVTYQGFPLVVMSKIWKPLFEWIGEISQTENTNYLSEIQEGGTQYFGRAFLFWIDKNNSPHWVYPDDVVDLTIDLGEEGRRSFKLEKTIFDAVNFIIYNSGEDMYGNGITYYLFDDTTEVATLKMRYQPMTKIVHTLIDRDIKEDANPTRNTAERDIYKQFPASYSPAIVPSFLSLANEFRAMQGQSPRVSVTSDSEYNDCLREAAKQMGWNEAKKITTKQSGLRYRGQIAIKGAAVNPGDLIQVTNPFIGLTSQYLRVREITHNINSNTFESTLDVEEDEKVMV